MVPQAAAATVTVSGTGFEANSVVAWNGNARPTTYVNSTTLQIALSAADVQNFGTGTVTVVNPGDTPTTPLDLLWLRAHRRSRHSALLTFRLSAGMCRSRW
jgi:hypothetical protein